MVISNCKECGGMLAPFYGRLKCIYCNKTYDRSEVDDKEPR